MNYDLRKNIDAEIGMLKEIDHYMYRASYAQPPERRLILNAMESLREGIKMLNNSIPEILAEITIDDGRRAGKDGRKVVERVQTTHDGKAVFLTVLKKDKKKFLNELEITEKFLKRARGNRKKTEEEYRQFRAARGYLKLANKLFLESAKDLSRKEIFKNLSIEIRKANLEVLFESYIAMMALSIVFSFVIGIVLFGALLFFNIGLTWPFFSVYTGSVLTRVFQAMWIPICLPILAFLALFYYPSAEKKSIEKKINQELPFAVIHMSAISGSGIEPSEIFRIIGLNKEYPNLRKEFRKILNQINLYGYDLVTALNNAAKSTPSQMLSELFSGLSITITSGSSLSVFLEKRSESLLLNYRLERERYTHLVETLLDIYISLVIAAPMIFLLLLIMMVVSGIQVGFTPGQISLLTVFGIALLNIVFIMLAGTRQPTY